MNESLNKLIQDFFKQNAYEYATLSALLGLLLSRELTIAQINSFGNFLENVGQTMLTIGAQQQVLKNASSSGITLDEALRLIKSKFDSLDEALNEIKNYIDKI